MISPTTAVIAPLYRLQYSRIQFFLEVLVFGILILSQLLVINGWWLLLGVSIGLLLSYVHFSRYSVIHGFSHDTRVEIRHKTEQLIWYHSGAETVFRMDQLEVLITRWFVYIQIGKDAQKLHRVLLADSFEDRSHYTHFRRQLIENMYAG